MVLAVSKTPFVRFFPLMHEAGSTMQRRGFATHIPSLPDEVFFNRKKEIEAFSQVLQSAPQISIVTGPVNSGKTALLRKILQGQVKLDRPVLHLDLRSQNCDTVNEFTSSLEIELSSWLNKLYGVASCVNYSAQVDGLIASLGNRSPIPIERLNNLFAKMDQQLSSYSWWTGKKSPILFIDEASKLRKLLKDERGHVALANMFDWFIKNTKQELRFHVVLGSSDSFFHLWVSEYVGCSRFTSYVVGDLPRNEAQKFWKEKVVIHLQGGMKPPRFGSAYKVCGGNMFLLENYYSQFLQEKGKMRPSDFSLIGEEKMRLLRAYFKKEDLLSHAEKIKPIWSQAQLIKIMEKLTDSKRGFLRYDDLCEELGSDVIDALIDYKFLHLRSSNNFAYDLQGVPSARAILTAETPSSLIAMRELLGDINRRNQKRTTKEELSKVVFQILSTTPVYSSQPPVL